MGEQRNYCPACGQHPLTRLPRKRVACPRGHVFDGRGWAYWAQASGDRPPELPRELPDYAGYLAAHPGATIFLGYACEPGCRPLLHCVAPTGQECLALLRLAFDTAKCEPVVLRLWAAGESAAGAARRAA